MNGKDAAIWGRLRVFALVVIVTTGSVVSGLALGPGTVAAADDTGTVTSTHQIDASDPNARFDPGQSGTIDVRLTNNATLDSGDDSPPTSVEREAGQVRIDTVNITDTDVAGEEPAPLTVETDKQYVTEGWIQDGNTTSPYPFQVQVDEDASAGTYVVNVTTEYTYRPTLRYNKTHGEYQTNGSTTTTTHTDTVTVEIEPQANFQVTDVSHDVPLGGEGTATVTVNNTGSENVTEATVSLTSQDSDFYFGSGTATTEAYIGDWNGSDERTVSVRAGTVESAVSREYPIDVTVDYTNSDGAATSDSTQIGIEPWKRDHFHVEVAEHTIPEDGEGTLAVSVRNNWWNGGDPFEDVTITATSSATDVYLGSEGSQSSSTFVEEWPYRDDKTIEFRVGTSEASLDREYPIQLQFEYTDDQDNQNQQTQYVHFSPTDRSFFEVESISHDIPQDGEGMVSVELEHQGDQHFEDVEITATTSDSAVYLGSEGSASATTYVGEWDDGDDETATFRVGTTESVVERQYPLQLQIDYTDAEHNQNSRTKYVDFTPTKRSFFAVESVDHDVPQNGEGTMSVSLEHLGSKPFEDVEVTATTADSAVYLGTEGSSTTSTIVEEWTAEDEETLTFRVGTTEEVLDRQYPIQLQFEYTDAADNQNSQTKYVNFTPTNRSFFGVESVSHDVPRNGDGTLSVSLEQLGSKPFEDVEVTASTADSAVYLGTEGSTSMTTMVEEWAAGETEPLTFRVGTTDAVVEQPYPIELTFDYTDADNNDNVQSKWIEFTPADQAHLSTGSVAHNVPQDGVGPVSLTLENTAEKPLTDLVVTATSSDSEIYIGSESSRSGSATIDELDPGDKRTITYHVGATSNAVNRTYPLELSLEYTDEDNNDNQQTEQIEFRPRPEPQFLVESVDHDVPIGSTGRVAVTLRNTGPVDATETVVTASSEADAMFLGTGGTEPVAVQGMTLEPPQTGTPTAQAFVGNWSTGETRTVYFRAGFDEDAIVRDYVMNLAIAYENSVGDEMPERTRSVGIEPLPEQHFSIRGIESDLFVGEEGDVRVAVTNTLARPVDGVVLTAETQEQNINFYNARYAVATLDPGESAVADFRIGVTGEAEPGPRVFEVATRYRDPQGNIRQTDSQDVLVSVGPSRDAFTLEVQSDTYEPGTSGPFKVNVTNQRNETLANIQARLFTDDPIDSDDDSAFIESLEPGETETIVLDLSVGGKASEKTYSASMDFRFDNARGESELSDTQRVPVEVRQPGSGWMPALWLVLGVMPVIGVITAWRFGTVDRLRDIYNDKLDG